MSFSMAIDIFIYNEGCIQSVGMMREEWEKFISPKSPEMLTATRGIICAGDKSSKIRMHNNIILE